MNFQELLKNSKSQAHQDIFAYFVCDNKNGYFLDIGSYDPVIGNNTFLLETNGWNGLCFDIDDYVDKYKNYRKNKFIQCDVTKINFNDILEQNKIPKIIDYLSIDVDDSTENFLKNFPFDNYDFKVITFEHDEYRNGPNLKNISRKFFNDLGYTLLCGNVNVTYQTDNDCFEDWYINDKYIDKNKKDILICYDEHESNILNIIKKNIFNFNFSYDKNENKLYISSSIKLDLTISIFHENYLIYSTVSNFNNNQFWYSPNINLYDFKNIKIEIKDVDNNLIEEKIINTDNINLIEDKKECIIIHYYISDYVDEYILNKSIDSINQSNIDIILVSHSQISKDIQKKVKYFFYDGEDDLVTFDDVFSEKTKIYTNKHFYNEQIVVQPFLFVVDDITYSFCKMVYNAFKISTALGYDYSYYIIGDFEIYENEILEMKKISKIVKENNKMGYFDESNKNSYGFTQEYLPNAFFWYVNNKWFMDNFFLNMDNKDNFLTDLKKLNLFCHYDWLVGYQVNKNRENLIVKKVNFWGHPFVSEDRSDLSKKKTISPYIKDVGIFYKNDIPYLFCFDFDKEKEKTKWDIYIEYNNETIKYSIQVISPAFFNIYQIDEIKCDNFFIKCENSITKKTKYNIFINNLQKYKDTFKIIDK